MQDTDTLAAPRPGAVVLGGTHSSLAVIRSLRHAGIPLWLVIDGSPVTSFSRYVHATLRWPGPNDPGAAGFLRQAAKANGLEGYLLIPAGDAEVRFASEQYDALRSVFRLPLRPWQDLRWAMDKTLAYGRARELGLSVPRSYEISSAEQAAAIKADFPVVLKPGMRVVDNPLMRDKAWRADDRDSFVKLYRQAAEYAGPGNLVVQELVPGGGDGQLSYGGLWNDGKPAAYFTARRARQFPLEFSHTSTFVETVDAPDVVEASHKFLTSIRHHGLVEVEFKRDPRNGQLKLLDVNPRPWSWFALADAAGVRLGEALWAMAEGKTVPQSGAPRSGIAWMYVPRDAIASLQLMMRGQLSPFAYLASFAKVRAWGMFSFKDPLPALLDIPISVGRIIKKKFGF